MAEYLLANFEAFFTAFNAMLEKGNYVTRRQSLKLLSELLLDRANVNSMMRYIGRATALSFYILVCSSFPWERS